MKWFEPLIALAAIGLVLLPIILKIINHKNGKSTCSCGCDCTSCNKDCLSNFKKYINSEEFKSSCHDIDQKAEIKQSA